MAGNPLQPNHEPQHTVFQGFHHTEITVEKGRGGTHG